MPFSRRTKVLFLKAIIVARRFRFWLAAGVGVLLFFQIIAFTPKRLEEETAPEAITEDALKPKEEPSLVSVTIPAGEVPEYTVEGFQYVSTKSGQKQWNLRADKAYFYQSEGIVHARDVSADLYDATGRITLVTAKEAKYFMQTRDLELFGDVRTTFPSGLETLSPYMLYEAKTKDVSVPAAYPVEGHSVPPTDPALAKQSEDSRERFEFRSKGLHYFGVKDTIALLSEVNMRVMKERTDGQGTDVTTIDSDRADIDRRKNIAHFTMLEARPSEQRFVKIAQPGMTSRSRRAEFRINANPRRVRMVKAMDDVKIEEKPNPNAEPSKRRRGGPSPVRYATAGEAEFDTEKNLIVLRQYPQVYQDRDTITGETIIVHRDSDLVEVDQSNAFSEGDEDQKH